MKAGKLIKELIMELMKELHLLSIEINKLQNENRNLQKENHELQREMNFQKNTITEL